MKFTKNRLPRRSDLGALASSLVLVITGAASGCATPKGSVSVSGRCTCADAHANYLPPAYAHALADEGLVTLDGSFLVQQ